MAREASIASSLLPWTKPSMSVQRIFVPTVIAFAMVHLLRCSSTALAYSGEGKPLSRQLTKALHSTPWWRLLFSLIYICHVFCDFYHRNITQHTYMRLISASYIYAAFLLIFITKFKLFLLIVISGKMMP